MRDNHCSFAKLNSNGRCIAPCTHNVQSDIDCTGKAGVTLDQVEGKETRVVCGPIDGRRFVVSHKEDHTYSVSEIWINPMLVY